MMKDNDRIGRLVTNGVDLLSHELSTIAFLRCVLQKDIELIPPSHTPNTKRPDFWMDGVAWEMKSPQGKELRVIERTFKSAARQSENIVIDLRRMIIVTDVVIRLLRKHFDLSRRVKRVVIITKEKNVVEFRKKSC